MTSGKYEGPGVFADSKGISCPNTYCIPEQPYCASGYSKAADAAPEEDAAKGTCSTIFCGYCSSSYCEGDYHHGGCSDSHCVSQFCGSGETYCQAKYTATA